MKEIDPKHSSIKATPGRFMVIYGSYRDISLGLYDDNKPHYTQTVHAVRASAQLLPLIDQLLTEQKCSLSDLSFIALDQGPGAFTSLRVVLTTINGVAFAQQVPLIGCDGLVGLMDQMASQVASAQNQPELLVAMLNAYNNEVYYSIRRRGDNGVYAPVGNNDYADINDLAENIASLNASSIWCAGNGANVHREALLKVLGETAHVDQVLRHASLDTLAHQALARWQTQSEPVYSLQPAYLKTQMFAKSG